MSLNVCCFSGNLTRDPELTHTKGGKAVVNFGIAVNYNFKRSDGSNDKEVFFADCEAWDTGAEAIAKYFKKGSSIELVCRAKTESWKAQDGTTRSKTKFRVDKFSFPTGSPKREDGPADNTEETSAESVAAEENVPF